MRRSVYIETTVVSFLTARPVRDKVLAGKLEATRRWWRDILPQVNPVCSNIVIAEAADGDPTAASLRLRALAPLPVLQASTTAQELAESLVQKAALPTKAKIDALHVAIAALHDIHFLLTWNCTHLANPTLKEKIRTQLQSAGYNSPLICTPHDLTEDAL